MTQLHLVTGATEFIGGALILELLHQTDGQIACIISPDNDTLPPQDYLERALCAAACAYGREDLLGEIQLRCRAVPGDILYPCCGNVAKEIGSISEVWHCADSLKYEEGCEEEVFLHNVQGTRNLLDLALKLKVPTFNYVSTAYLAENLTGRILEEPLASDIVLTNSGYEKSKVQAELLVANTEGIHTRILRPSIVIAHSKTYAATGFSELSNFIQKIHSFKRWVSKLLGNFLSYRQLRIRANAEVPLNFIPVDVFANNAVSLSRSNCSACIFHLTNEYSLTVGQTINLIFKEIGIREPQFVPEDLSFTSIDQSLDKAISNYSSYLLKPKIFDRTNTDAALGSAASHFPLNELIFLPYIRWYLDSLADKKQVTLKKNEL